jgi:hypothetical protein
MRLRWFIGVCDRFSVGKPLRVANNFCSAGERLVWFSGQQLK